MGQELFHTVFIVSPAPIIREGLMGFLRMYGLSHRIAVVAGSQEIDFSISHTSTKLPNLAIIDSRLWRDFPVANYRREFQNIFFIGLTTSFASRAESNPYPTTIYLDDSEEQIVELLQTVALQAKNSLYSTVLSEREKDVLRLLTLGLSNKEVADRLNISQHTVISHRKNIIEKTGIKSLAGLTVYAILHNITEAAEINK